MKHRLLLIAYEMPPRPGPHSLRLAHFLKHLNLAGWRIHALGSEPLPDRSDPHLQEMVRGTAEIETCLSRGRSPSLRWLISCVFRSIRIFRSDPYDIILSSGPPFVSHMAGYLVSLATRTPWIADYGDPFARNPAYRRSSSGQWLAATVEKLWLSRARRIVLTTESARRLYETSYPRMKARPAYIPMGYEPSDYTGLNPDPGNRKFVLAFAGSLHANITNGPECFLKALNRIFEQRPDAAGDFKVLFVGTTGIAKWIDGFVPENRRDVFRIYDYLPFPEMIAVLNRSTCLVMWGIVGGLQIPSKLYVYLGLKKPVLAILNDPDDAIREILSENGRGICVEDREDAIAGAIENLHDLWKRGAIFRTFSSTDIPGFTWQNIGRQLNTLLESEFR
ncbi:glycosyltransferase [bacterium]|nr:glycosyltransferase [candidate division CSSED10-310 bacterium]